MILTVMNVEKLVEECEGKPAPMPLLLVQAFANTLDVEDSIDRLKNTESFAGWLRDAGLSGRRLLIRRSDLLGARRLREAVRALLVANARDQSDPDAARILGRLAAHYPVALHADAEGTLEPDLGPVNRAEDLIPQLLAIVFFAQATGSWNRLKLCENPECLWAFYDHSKNRSGSWCRMGLCGNRLKNRAYRERQRSR